VYIKGDGWFFIEQLVEIGFEVVDVGSLTTFERDKFDSVIRNVLLRKKYLLL
jgi:hypothetical protein